MDLPTPPAGMPVPDTVQAASAAVLDAPPAGQPGPAAGGGAPAPGAVGGGAVGAVAGGGAAGGLGGPALPGPRAHSGMPIRAELPQQADGRPQDQRGQDQRAGDQRGRDERAGGRTESADGRGTDTPPPSDVDELDPTPATGFGVAVPLGGPLGGQLGGVLAGGIAGGLGIGQQPFQQQARPGGGAVFGTPGGQYPPHEQSGLSRLPGVFAGASIGDSNRDQLSLFLLHLFPIGHLPQVLDEPHVQLPAPQAEVDYAAGLRFPPDDHPDARLVDATTPAPVTRTEGGSTARIAEGYDPLGGMHERDWERRYLVRPADGRGRAEYAWPPGEQYPEGGCADGEPAVLQPGTTLDRIGTPEGRVFAEDATAFAARSLPPDQLDAPLRRYTVVRPLPVWRTASAPWFAQRGGGIRLRTTRSAVELVALGYLVEITEDER